MRKHRLNKYERETIFLTPEGDDTGDIYTFNTNLNNRLKKFAAQHPDFCSMKDENKEYGSVSYTIQKSRVSIRLLAPCSGARRKAQGSQRICKKAYYNRQNQARRTC